MPDPTNRGVGRPLRLSILLAILISAGFAAIYLRGKRQAFWAGFFVAMLLLYGQLFNVPDFMPVANSWSGGLLQSTIGDEFDMLATTMWALLMLSFSAIVGFIAAIIYDRSQSKT